MRLDASDIDNLILLDALHCIYKGKPKREMKMRILG